MILSLPFLLLVSEPQPTTNTPAFSLLSIYTPTSHAHTPTQLIHNFSTTFPQKQVKFALKTKTKTAKIFP